ncbi:Uncharacterised protein [Bordetella pertussis]|nr:Uncharacterised protein [Bordetella pertussis]
MTRREPGWMWKRISRAPWYWPPSSPLKPILPSKPDSSAMCSCS